jgi:hypothetical protein
MLVGLIWGICGALGGWMPAAAIWEYVSDDWAGRLSEAGATDPCKRRPARVDAGIHR